MGHVLPEVAPRDVDVPAVEDALRAVPGDAALHDLHVGTINKRSPAASAHLVVTDAAGAGCGDDSVLDTASTMLRERFGITQSTLQIERDTLCDHEHPCS